MKRFKLTLLTAAALMMFSGSVFAQTTINANAEVLADLTVTQEQAINFGIVEQDFTTNGDPVIDPKDASTTGAFVDVTDVTAGLVSVVGTGDQTVDITVDTDITLNEDAGPHSMTLTPSYNWTLDNLTTGAPTNPVLGSNTAANFSMVLDGSGDNDDGQNTILIGGTLTQNNTPLNAGTYSGTGSITVAYQ